MQVTADFCTESSPEVRAVDSGEDEKAADVGHQGQTAPRVLRLKAIQRRQHEWESGLFVEKDRVDITFWKTIQRIIITSYAGDHQMRLDSFNRQVVAVVNHQDAMFFQRAPKGIAGHHSALQNVAPMSGLQGLEIAAPERMTGIPRRAAASCRGPGRTTPGSGEWSAVGSDPPAPAGRHRAVTASRQLPHRRSVRPLPRLSAVPGRHRCRPRQRCASDPLPVRPPPRATPPDILRRGGSRCGL